MVMVSTLSAYCVEISVHLFFFIQSTLSYSDPSSSQATNSSTTFSTGIILLEAASVLPPSSSTPPPPPGITPTKLPNTSLKASSSPPKGPKSGVA
mmetsp:Transcript_17800/g.27270  ORF Transcript_17800/g.27270 Transcript_17800/m.27270 type:complete len:95 (+) Transcript_17800:65-349(+)